MAGFFDRFGRTAEAVREPDRGIAQEQRFKVMPGEGLFLDTLDTYNPDVLLSRKGLRIVDEMMRDDQVKAAMSLKMHSPVSGGWEILPGGESTKNETHAEFIRDVISMMRGTVEQVLQNVTLALPYGCSLQEMVLKKQVTGKWRGKLVIDKIVSHAPHNIRWITDKDEQEVVAADQWIGGGGEPLPLWKCLLYRWNSMFENPWGQTDLDAAYRAWFSKDWTIRHWNILAERSALQRLIVKYEEGLESFANEMVDEWVESIGLSVPEGVTVDFEGGGSDTKASSEVFSKAVEMHDQAISRSILKQTLAQGEGARVGSLAMARVHQDTLLMEMAKVQSDVAEGVMTEQFIRLLIDLNFGPQEDYPIFSLADMFPTEPAEFVEFYIKLIKEGGIVLTKEDEDRIREVSALPPREGDDPPPGKKAAPSPTPGAGFAPIPGEEEEEVEEEEGEEFVARRKLTPSEKRVDFQKIDTRFNDLEEIAVDQLTQTVEKIEEKVLKDVERRFFKDGMANAAEVNKINIPFLGEIRQVFNSFGVKIFDDGQSDLVDSMKKGGDQFAAANPGGLSTAQQTAAFKKNWAARAGGVATDFGASVERDVRNVLLKALQNGETQATTEAKLQQVFEKWKVGSTVPGGAVDPWRIETIVRTNFTNAYNQGRLVASRDPDLAGFVQAYQYSAVLDDRTSDTCDSLDGIVLAANDPQVDIIVPPSHFNCRSILVEVLKHEVTTLSSERAVSSAVAGIQEGFK